MARERLDALMTGRGLAPTRSRAQALVLAGHVRVDGAPAHKPGQMVAADADVTVAATDGYVSRAGGKLANAVDHLGWDVAGVRALDVGASTGGFTDCLLRRGAGHVIALDVGYGQLAWSLRNDPRVTVMERTNARHLTPGGLVYPPDFVAADVSFISLTLVWPAVVACAAPGWRACLMVKPQFEAGRRDVGSGGVVRDPEVRRRAVNRVAECVAAWGGAVLDASDSGVPGPKGNREVFLALADARDAATAPDIDERIGAAVEAGTSPAPPGEV